MKILRLLLLVTMLAVVPLAAYAHDFQPATFENTSEEDAVVDVQHQIYIWLAAVSTGNSDAVAKLYADDAVLLPTLSPLVCNTPALRKAYFDEFTAKPNLIGVINQMSTRVLDDENAVNSGLYTFSYTFDGKTVNVPARFTFVYHKGDDGWQIVEHHSSAIPADH